ncbi:acyl CoA:acetate/3-ketoacid CoA transferase [uncultured Megasphaera sp.]|uniref:acyl CoA:acetate/3-ketoacid CoA transferase n=2 Tax=uncultured Megasphaera sp. TaxID=165188 RepID=UPI0025914A14|nr:CoA-transferase [uncultured Megasphaera sp.]
MTEFITPAEAADLLLDGQRLGISGFSGFGTPEAILAALGERYKREQKPRNLVLCKAAGVGDYHERGVNHLALPGLVKSIITSYMAQEPSLRALADANELSVHMVPLGTLTSMYRAMARKDPGVWTRVGLHTFVDPRLGCGKVNERARQEADLCEVRSLEGREYLFYPAFPYFNMVFIRGTYADADGNISFEKEALLGEQLELAAACRSGGGTVVVQVEDIVPKGSLDPRYVKLHHVLVDYVVKADPEQHPQSFGHDGYWPELCGEARKPLVGLDLLPLDACKVCARRAAMRLEEGMFVNLGIGMPEGVGSVAAEEGIGDVVLSTESGVIGGVPLTGLDMGASINPECISSMPAILDLYDGGLLDMAVLGLAEVDRHCNINVSRFHGKFTGPGGFIDISQNAKRVLVIGTFTAGGLQETFRDGKLVILKEGKYKKFKKDVEQITFSGPFAYARTQEVQIITERAVFNNTKDGLTLMEYAPGIDIERDIIGQMEFRPKISKDLKEMDSRLFKESKMGLGCHHVAEELHNFFYSDKGME